MSQWHRHPRHGATTTPASSPHWLPGCGTTPPRPSAPSDRQPRAEAARQRDRALDRCARLDTTERMGNFQIAAAGTLRRAPGRWSPRPPRCSSAVLVVAPPAHHHHLRQRRSPTGTRVGTRREQRYVRLGGLGRLRTIPTKFCRALGYAGPAGSLHASQSVGPVQGRFTATRDASGGSQRPKAIPCVEGMKCTSDGFSTSPPSDRCRHTGACPPTLLSSLRRQPYRDPAGAPPNWRGLPFSAVP